MLLPVLPPGATECRQEAFLIALACSDAPQGRARWTLQMLADHLSVRALFRS